MRITCENIPDFLTCLKDVESIFQSVIRINKKVHSISELKAEITIQVCCVVISNPGEYLLETGQFCGFDYSDGDKRKDGTDQFESCKRAIGSFCVERGWKTLPGQIHI